MYGVWCMVYVYGLLFMFYGLWFSWWMHVIILWRICGIWCYGLNQYHYHKKLGQKWRHLNQSILINHNALRHYIMCIVFLTNIDFSILRSLGKVKKKHEKHEKTRKTFKNRWKKTTTFFVVNETDILSRSYRVEPYGFLQMQFLWGKKCFFFLEKKSLQVLHYFKSWFMAWHMSFEVKFCFYLMDN